MKCGSLELVRFGALGREKTYRDISLPVEVGGADSGTDLVFQSRKAYTDVNVLMSGGKFVLLCIELQIHILLFNCSQLVQVNL